MLKVLRGGIVFFASAWFACASTAPGPRSPSSTGRPDGAPRDSRSKSDLGADVAEALEFVRGPGLTPGNCGPSLKRAFAQAFDIKPAQLDAGALRGDGARTIEKLFQIRHHLRARLAEFDQRGEADDRCVSAVRDALRASRVLEDYLSEWHAGYPVDDPKSPVGAFNGSFPWLQLHPDHPRLDFRSGDVFLSRGTAFTSAMISRITDDDANFSHLAILYIDEATKKKWMVEAHIEVGSKTATFNEYLFDGKARVVQLRHADPELAHRAAKLIHDKVKKATDFGANICYDFGMDIADRECLFCSEVVSAAFAMASGEAVQVPRFLSSINMKNPDFTRRLGVTATKTFAPADIEIDGRFTVLAEWRDLGKVNRLHEYDAIMTSVLSWMDDHGYVLHDSHRTKLTAKALHKVRPWPVFSSVLKNKFPTNMPRPTLAMVMTLDDIGERLLARLSQANAENREKTGFWLTPGQMQEFLERYRQDDLQRFESGGAVQFHQWIRKKR